MKKEVIKQAVDHYLPELVKIADEIYDLAEPGMEEVRSAGLLTDYLEKMGFQVEKGIAGLPTAFRAVYEQGQGGPSFGLLAECDALKRYWTCMRTPYAGAICDRCCPGTTRYLQRPAL